MKPQRWPQPLGRFDGEGQGDPQPWKEPWRNWENPRCGAWPVQPPRLRCPIMSRVERHREWLISNDSSSQLLGSNKSNESSSTENNHPGTPGSTTITFSVFPFGRLQTVRFVNKKSFAADCVVVGTCLLWLQMLHRYLNYLQLARHCGGPFEIKDGHTHSSSDLD